MDAGLVCKCICADNRLGRSNRNAGNGLNHAAGTVNLLGVNAGIAVKVILAGLECHDNFFQGSIAGALADAIDGTLYLTDACLNAGQRVCNAHAQIIVVMAGQNDVFHAIYMLAQVLNQIVVLARRQITGGIRNVDGIGAGLDCRVDNAAQEIPIRTGCVLSRELDVVQKLLGVRHMVTNALENLFRAHLQLVLHVNRRSCQKYVNARINSFLDCAPSGVNVLLNTARQRAYGRILDGMCNGCNCSGITRGCNGKACLHNINAQSFQLTSYLNFLAQVHAAAGRLLAISQGRIKNANLS